ncbi:glycogen/starch synthase [Haliea sp. E1-2-M8]|uniref:glycogen synthase n=1 Tax=Haliea sp. E1-2-M8 TaxID=3064706 RepID=UPI002726DE35|nr:glycogen/starch synthase [Haliea sp. E1-2-M8]MDO8861698.1 glycogen/starch synthase [Haliea sp. E1-2-M8]
MAGKQNSPLKLLLLAAENGALPGGKVGGMGDVIRDIPRALAALGHDVSVLVPGYQHFSHLPGATLETVLEVAFRNGSERVELWSLPADPAHPGVRCQVLEHPLLAPCGPGQIYCDDGPGRPFATDASKFALFCAAVATALRDGVLPWPDRVHLHDWHTALVPVLARFEPEFAALDELNFVYTIHNLALQGIRPLRDDDSALEAWFPRMRYDYAFVGDPRYPDCFNPMRAGIRLCHKVHAVSPTYAREIQGDAGEGLAEDLQQAQREGRLEGILNGCEYPQPGSAPVGFDALLAATRAELKRWQQGAAADCVAQAVLKVDRWRRRKRPSTLVTSVGRLTDQKVRLLRLPCPDGRSVLEHLLDRLGHRGLFLMLGSGAPELEAFFAAVSARTDNFVFLRGFSEPLSEKLYAGGDLFLMPSSFEPCGISQMLAMRAGQPCLVHAVGGLADTVRDGVNGFAFSGVDEADQARHLLQRFDQVLALRAAGGANWDRVCEAAAAARFKWTDVARAYQALLYQ